MIIENPRIAPANPTRHAIHPDLSPLRGKEIFMIIIFGY